MSPWSPFASLRPPREKNPPPRWLKALWVYPNASWAVAERNHQASRRPSGFSREFYRESAVAGRQGDRVDVVGPARG